MCPIFCGLRTVLAHNSHIWNLYILCFPMKILTYWHLYNINIIRSLKTSPEWWMFLILSAPSWRADEKCLAWALGVWHTMIDCGAVVLWCCVVWSGRGPRQDWELELCGGGGVSLFYSATSQILIKSKYYISHLLSHHIHNLVMTDQLTTRWGNFQIGGCLSSLSLCVWGEGGLSAPVVPGHCGHTVITYLGQTC